MITREYAISLSHSEVKKFISSHHFMRVMLCAMDTKKIDDEKIDDENIYLMIKSLISVAVFDEAEEIPEGLEYKITPSDFLKSLDEKINKQEYSVNELRAYFKETIPKVWYKENEDSSMTIRFTTKYLGDHNAIIDMLKRLKIDVFNDDVFQKRFRIRPRVARARVFKKMVTEIMKFEDEVTITGSRYVNL